MFQGDLFPVLSPLAISPFDLLCQRLGVEQHGFWVDHFGQSLRKWAQTKSFSRINTLSLFSGAGGLDIGFHDAGFKITHAVEIDERFVQSLLCNSQPGGYIDGVQVVCKDIRDFSLSNNEKIDFIIGGPPCQTFSAAGRRASGVAGLQDERGTLFNEYVRLLKEVKPEGFLFENVYGIVGAEGGKPWQDIQDAFSSAGYKIHSRILDAADYGVAQHRERLIIVGTKCEEFLFPKPTHGPDSPTGKPHVSAGQALSGCENQEFSSEFQLGGRYGHLLAQVPPGLNYSFFTEEMGHPEPIFSWRSKFSDFLYKADPERPVRTIKAQGGQYTGPFHWRSRPFSVCELKRLQSFPEKYRIEGGRQLAINQIGNSVPPQLARILALSVLEQVFEVSAPISLPKLGTNEELSFRKRKRDLSKDYKNKATDAISTLKTKQDRRINDRSYFATLNEKFEFLIKNEGDILVNSVTDSGKIIISVRNNGNIFLDSPEIMIKLSSNNLKPWALGKKTVELRIFGTSKRLFTASWKAFEAELVFRTIKADIVQLCGYYQYPPNFSCRMNIYNEKGWEWECLGKIVSGVGTQRTIPQEEFANLLGIRPNKVLDFALFLKDCGYEARTNSTNPQIEIGHILVPYAFPTLSPQSVQLHKKIKL